MKVNSRALLLSLAVLIIFPIQLPAMLQFTSVTRQGTNLILSGMGGVTNGIYTLLKSTNLTLPSTNWMGAATNSFDGIGRFSLTDSLCPARNQEFYSLKTLPTPDPIVTVTVDMSSSNGVPKRIDFAGLSFGIKSLDNNFLGTGAGYIFDTNHSQSPKCNQLITLCTNMGLQHIRIGGTSVDFTIPLTDYDYTGIDAFFNFASAIGANVIYTLRFLNSNTGADYTFVDDQIAAHIWSNSAYQALVDSFAIGNEPSSYQSDDTYPLITNFTSYCDKWTNMAASVVSATSSNVGFSGADSVGSSDWTQLFISNKYDGMITEAIKNTTIHNYVGGNTDGVSVVEAITNMLSSNWLDNSYPNFQSTRLNVLDGWNYRITEADDYVAGIAGASDRFCAALWGLDYLCWQAQASDHSKGVNFHNNWGDPNATIYLDENGNFQVTPKWAAIRMFGFFYPGTTYSKSVTVTNNSNINVTCYGSGNSTNCLALVINKSNTINGDGTEITLTVQPSHFTAHNAQYIQMVSYPVSNDVTQPQAMVGGSVITNNAAWNGNWTSIRVTNNSCTLTCGETAAVLVRMY